MSPIFHKLTGWLAKPSVKHFLLVAGVGLCWTLLVGHKVIFSGGVIVLAENLEVDSLDALGANYAPFWQDRFQYYDFGIIDSVYSYGGFVILGRLLGLSYELVQRLMLLLPHGIALVCAYYLLRYVLGRQERPLRGFALAAACFAGGFAYACNPWITVQPRDIALRFDYALAPLMLLLFMRVFERRKGWFPSAAAFSMVLAFTTCPRFLLLILPALTLYVLLPSDGGDCPPLGRRLVRFAGVLLMVALLVTGKFLAPVLYALQADAVPYAQSFRDDMITGASILDILSTHVLGSFGRTIWDEVYTDRAYQLFLIVSIGSFAFLPLARGLTRREIYWPVLLVSYAILSILKSEPLEDFWLWALTQAPLSGLYGRLLRFADWNVLPALPAVAVMTGLTAARVLRAVPQRGRLAVAGLLASIVASICVLSAWPIVTGNLNGYWRGSEVPPAFQAVNEALRRDGDECHVVWAPGYWENRATWAANTGPYETTGPTCNFDTRSSAKPSYLTEQFYFFDYYAPLGARPGLHPLEGYTGGNLPRILGDVNVRYVAIHNDVAWHRIFRSLGYGSANVAARVDALKEAGRAERIDQYGFITLLQAPRRSQAVQVRTPVAVLGGLPVHGSLVDAGCDLRHVGLIYLESRSLDPAELREVLRASPVLLTKGQDDVLDSLVACAADARHRFAPYKSTLESDFRQAWIRSTVAAGVGSPLFQEVLKEARLDCWSWDFDFGAGLVFTTAAGAELSVPADVDQDGPYAVMVRVLESPEGGGIVLNVGGKDLEMPTVATQTRLVWKTFTDVAIAPGRHGLVLRNERGINAVNLVLLVPMPQFQQLRREMTQILDGKPCIAILEAETDLQRLDPNITTRQDATAGNGQCLKLPTGARCRGVVDLHGPGKYRITVRGQGKLRLKIDDLELPLTCEPMSETPAGRIEVRPGRHWVEVSAREGEAILDAIYAGPDGPEGRLADWIEAIPRPVAEVVSAGRWSGATREVRVRSQGPFLLCLAEGHDRMTEARTPDGRCRPVPVFGLIDGFLMDGRGELEVTIIRRPQVWTQVGLWVSLLSAVGMVGYCVFQAIRRRVRAQAHPPPEAGT